MVYNIVTLVMVPALGCFLCVVTVINLSVTILRL